MKHSHNSYNGYDRDSSNIGNDWIIKVVCIVAEAHVSCYSVRNVLKGGRRVLILMAKAYAERSPRKCVHFPHVRSNPFLALIARLFLYQSSFDILISSKHGTNQVNPSWTVNPCWAVDPC